MNGPEFFVLPNSHRIALPRQIVGVDFSGGQQAGNHIWITRGSVANGRLLIVDCRPARRLENGGVKRGKALSALFEMINTLDDAAVGLDFSFSVPRDILQQQDWQTFVRGFSERFASPENFRNFCRGISDKPELKRVSDVESETPFSPYNLWIFRQTFYGIRDVLSPLLNRQKGCILPFQNHNCPLPWIMETCPASLLKKIGLYQAYKSKQPAAQQQRARILEFVMQTFDIGLENELIRTTILNDTFGDALDSLLAATIVFRQLKRPEALLRLPRDPYSREGMVYF
ncbi:MAG: hypothetical protein KDI06_02470 [Calditrichaeota bacterium]|nr:hypothetical protein [Calditrichota bacterium]HQU72205.1 hypothetical protein [Calditrichia bacterium]